MPTKMERLKTCCKTSSVRLIWLFLSFVVYLCFGAFVFSVMERHKEEEIRKDLYKTIDDFLDQNDCIDGKVDISLSFSRIFVFCSYCDNYNRI